MTLVATAVSQVRSSSTLVSAFTDFRNADPGCGEGCSGITFCEQSEVVVLFALHLSPPASAEVKETSIHKSTAPYVFMV
jgi:hypothetical protein